jgi:predicted ATPase/class 3 adenylate cyclase
VSGRVLGVFLFTDVVGSTRLWSGHTDAMQTDLAAHDGIVQKAAARHDGTVFSTAGDSFGIAFPSAAAAVDAAVEIQQALADHPWEVPGGIGVRMGIHLGDAQRRDDNYYGPVVNEAARVMAAAHAGQIVASDAVVRFLDGVPTTPLGDHRLRDLDGTWTLHQVDVPGQPNRHPPLRTLDRHRSTLPLQRSSLVGREHEVERLGAAVDQHRLVTILGPGGAGKTRTAVEVAGRTAARFPDGLFFVDLTRAADDDAVAGAFVDGISRAAPPGREPVAHLTAELTDQRALLVVDNCEHVVDAVAELIDELLVATSELHVLATSRVVLDVEGEHTMVLPPLDAGSTDSPAVQLFVERALAVDSNAVFDDQAMTAIRQLAQRLDGIPLAIELAAARTRSLSPAQILDHLDDRFRLLVGSRRGGDRHHTLEAAIAWSYDLLTDSEQQTFRVLSVCGGPFALETVARLLGDDALVAADRIESLVARSLLTVVETGGRVRGYRMLESMREFGRRELVERGELDDARCAVELALLPPLEEIDADYFCFVNVYAVWNERTTLEATTRREAATLALEAGRVDVAAHLFASATSPEEPGGHHRMLAQLDVLKERIDELSPSAARSVRGPLALLHAFTGSYAAALETSAESLALLSEDDPHRRFPEALVMMFSLPFVEPPRVLAETDEILERAIRHAGRPPDALISWMALSRAGALQGDRARIESAREQARIGVQWAPAGAPRQQAVAMLLLIEYLGGLERGPELAAAADEPIVGNEQPLIGVAAALAADAPVEERARRLSALARRRPLGLWMHEESPFIAAFALLALEEDDVDRAEALLKGWAPGNPGTAYAGLDAICEVTERRTGRRPSYGEVLGGYMTSELREQVAAIESAVLTDELAYWDERLR